MAEGSWEILMVYATPLIALGALVGLIASGIALGRAPRGQRVGPAIALTLCLLCSWVALGFGACYGLMMPMHRS